MTPARTFLQTIALGALLTAQMHGALLMPGVRQALRTIDVPVARQTQPAALPAAVAMQAPTGRRSPPAASRGESIPDAARPARPR